MALVLPHDFPSQMAHRLPLYFRKWRIVEGTWERINRAIRENALGSASKGILSPARAWWILTVGTKTTAR